MSELATHLLRQVKREPRLAWLIGPGSQTWTLLMQEAGLTGDDRKAVERDLQYTPWPTDLIRAVEGLLEGSWGIDIDVRQNLIEALTEAGGRAP